jgi:hypothetical protein
MTFNLWHVPKIHIATKLSNYQSPFFYLRQDWPESNLLELARGIVLELFPNSFSISFSHTADWPRFRDLLNDVTFCKSAALEKEIEKKFRNNGAPPLAMPRRWRTVIKDNKAEKIR